MYHSDFSVFDTNPTLIYLDSAATTLRPRQVIEAVATFSGSAYGPIHRGLYPLSVQATGLYEQARATVATFLNAPTQEIIFTSGATDSLNQICWGLSKTLGPNDIVLVSTLEHHSALLPWQQAAQERGFRLQFCELDEHAKIRITKLDPRVKVISMPLISNVTGTGIDCGQISNLAHANNAILIVDASQAVSHMPLDVQKLGCDFLVFSGHKMYGPTGVGVLWGKAEKLAALAPYRMGGEMVSSATTTTHQLADIPYRFEAGTPNADGVIGLAAAIGYLQDAGMDAVRHHVEQHTKILINGLASISEVKLLAKPELRAGLVSFTVQGIHPHDISEFLGRQDICIRAGQQCAGPAHQALNVAATCRASIGLYTDASDINTFISAVKEVILDVVRV